MTAAKKTLSGWTGSFGYIPDLPDHRDFMLRFPMPPGSLPPRTDLVAGLPPVWNQGNLGSCTAHGSLAGHAFAQTKRTGKTAIMLSRLQAYYEARRRMGTTRVDSGATIRDAVKALAAKGAGREELWPYYPKNFAIEPSEAAKADGLKHQAISYWRLGQDEGSLCGCLAEGWPVVFGFTVYESFQRVGADGVVPMPGKKERVLGGHCMLLVGYDLAKRQYKARNSWGPDWGSKGHCFMPFAYLGNSDLAADFWTIRSVES